MFVMCEHKKLVAPVFFGACVRVCLTVCVCGSEAVLARSVEQLHQGGSRVSSSWPLAPD